MREPGTRTERIPASYSHLLKPFFCGSAYRPIARFAISLAVERAISGHIAGRRISMP